MYDMKKKQLKKEYPTPIIHVPRLDIVSCRKAVLVYSDWRDYKIVPVFSHGNQRCVESGDTLSGYYESLPQLTLIKK